MAMRLLLGGQCMACCFLFQLWTTLASSCLSTVPRNLSGQWSQQAQIPQQRKRQRQRQDQNQQWQRATAKEINSQKKSCANQRSMPSLSCTASQEWQTSASSRHCSSPVCHPGKRRTLCAGIQPIQQRPFSQIHDELGPDHCTWRQQNRSGYHGAQNRHRKRGPNSCYSQERGDQSTAADWFVNHPATCSAEVDRWRAGRQVNSSRHTSHSVQPCKGTENETESHRCHRTARRRMAQVHKSHERAVPDQKRRIQRITCGVDNGLAVCTARRNGGVCPTGSPQPRKCQQPDQQAWARLRYQRQQSADDGQPSNRRTVSAKTVKICHTPEIRIYHPEILHTPPPPLYQIDIGEVREVLEPWPNNTVFD